MSIEKEFEGETVTDAAIEACKELGISRDELEFNKSHILNAKLAPANPGEILRWVNEDDPIVTYCSGGECDLSLELARVLMGEDWAFSKVFVYDGGITEWENAGFPINKLNE